MCSSFSSPVSFPHALFPLSGSYLSIIFCPDLNRSMVSFPVRVSAIVSFFRWPVSPTLSSVASYPFPSRCHSLPFILSLRVLCFLRLFILFVTCPFLPHYFLLSSNWFVLLIILFRSHRVFFHGPVPRISFSSVRLRLSLQRLFFRRSVVCIANMIRTYCKLLHPRHI